MRRRELLKVLSHCCRVFMITLLLLLVLIFFQLFVLETFQTFLIAKKSSSQVQQSATEPLERQQRIDRSIRLFLPDGTAHLAYLDYQLPQNQRPRIYDTNDNLLWQGTAEELPESYLKWPGSFRRYFQTYSLRRYQAIYPDSHRSIVVPVL